MQSAQSVIEMTGVSQNAAKIYLALLKKGKGNYSSLSTVSGLHPQSVKNGLRELIDNKYVIRLDHKLTQTMWKPVPPYEIVKRLKRQYEEFARAVPMLQGLFRENPTTLVRVSAGMQEVVTHLERMIDGTAPGTAITFIGQNWHRLATEQPASWVECVEQAEKKSIRILRMNGQTMGNGPMSIAVAEQAVIFFVFDPTESTVITIVQKGLAKQIQGLLRTIKQPSNISKKMLN